MTAGLRNILNQKGSNFFAQQRLLLLGQVLQIRMTMDFLQHRHESTQPLLFFPIFAAVFCAPAKKHL